MDSSSGLSYILLVVLVALSAFFSASETALNSINKIRMKNMADNGDQRAAKTLEVAEKYESMISTRMDGQTAMGKAPVGVAALAKKYGKPVLAFAGAVERDARKCNEHGIDAFFPILRGVVTLEEAMKNENAKRNLADTAEQVYRTFTIL